MRRADRRDEILRRAVVVFGRLGYHSATTAELARAAGVSEALLYQHFPSKQALLIACIESLGEEIHRGLQAVLAPEQNPTETFRNLTVQLTKFLRARPELSRFTLVIAAELEEPAIRDAVRAMISRNVDLIARALKRGQQRGVLRADLDTYATAWVLAGMYQLFGLVERLGIEDALRPDALQTLVLPFLETDRPGPRQPPSS